MIGKSKPISLGKPDRVIESDSSGTGFGARDVTHNQDCTSNKGQIQTEYGVHE